MPISSCRVRVFVAALLLGAAAGVTTGAQPQGGEQSPKVFTLPAGASAEIFAKLGASRYTVQALGIPPQPGEPFEAALTLAGRPATRRCSSCPTRCGPRTSGFTGWTRTAATWR
jgi:hypothetical protein